MKKLGLLLVIFLMAGCTNKFNSNDRTIIFKEGKPYLVPKQSRYSFLDKKDEFPCSKGEVVWFNPRFLDKLVEFGTKHGQEAFDRELKKSVYTNHVGCSQSLSDKEYDYYKYLDAQNKADRRAYLEYKAKTTPKTYNINHTGSIYYYGN